MAWSTIVRFASAKRHFTYFKGERRCAGRVKFKRGRRVCLLFFKTLKARSRIVSSDSRLHGAHHARSLQLGRRLRLRPRRAVGSHRRAQRGGRRVSSEGCVQSFKKGVEEWLRTLPKLVVCGGATLHRTSTSGGQIVPTRKVLKLNLAELRWKRMHDLTRGRCEHACCVVRGGVVVEQVSKQVEALVYCLVVNTVVSLYTQPAV